MMVFILFNLVYLSLIKDNSQRLSTLFYLIIMVQSTVNLAMYFDKTWIFNMFPYPIVDIFITIVGILTIMSFTSPKSTTFRYLHYGQIGFQLLLLISTVSGTISPWSKTGDLCVISTLLAMIFWQSWKASSA